MDPRLQRSTQVHEEPLTAFEGRFSGATLSIQETAPWRQILESAVSQGQYEEIDAIVNHDRYRQLSIPKQSEIRREIVNASHDFAQRCYSKGENDKARLALMQCFSHGEKIFDMEDADHAILGSGRRLSALCYLSQSEEKLALEEFTEAITLLDKISEKIDVDYYNLLFCYTQRGKQQAKSGHIEEALEDFQCALKACESQSDATLKKNKNINLLNLKIQQLHRVALAREARGWGYAAIGKPSSSLVQAVLEQLRLLKLVPSETTVADLGKRLNQHAQQFKKYYTGDLGCPELSEYIDQLIAASGIYDARHALEVLLVSRAMRVNVVVFCCDYDDPIVFKQAGAIGTLILGATPEKTYQSFALSQELKPERSLGKHFSESMLQDNFYNTPKQKRGYSPSSRVPRSIAEEVFKRKKTTEAVGLGVESKPLPAARYALRIFDQSRLAATIISDCRPMEHSAPLNTTLVK